MARFDDEGTRRKAGGHRGPQPPFSPAQSHRPPIVSVERLSRLYKSLKGTLSLSALRGFPNRAFELFVF